MPKTTVDVDAALLAAAKERLGTSTIKDTINAALREVTDRAEREEAIDAVAALVKSGDFDWKAIEDKENYRATADRGEIEAELSQAEQRVADLLSHTQREGLIIESKPGVGISTVLSTIAGAENIVLLPPGLDWSEEFRTKLVRRLEMSPDALHKLRISVAQLSARYGHRPDRAARDTLAGVEALLEELDETADTTNGGAE